MNTPKIRFKGFTDDWEQRKLGEIVLRESLARESTIDLPYVEYEDVIAEEGRINKDIRKKEGIKKGISRSGLYPYSALFRSEVPDCVYSD